MIGRWTTRAAAGLLLLSGGGRAGAAEAGGGACLVDAGEGGGPAYKVVLLVDRSGSMRRVPDAIAEARRRAEELLGRMEGAGADRVGVKLAAFDAGLRPEVFPGEPGSWASPGEAARELARFLPVDAAAYDGGRTCIRRSVYQLVHRELPAAVPGPHADLARPVPWDFLVFTDEREDCGLDDRAERAWVERNAGRGLLLKVWPLASPDPPELMTGYLAVWNAPLAGVVNLHEPRRERLAVPAGVVTFVPRLLGGPEAARCPPAQAGGAAALPTVLRSPGGGTTDEGAWRVEPGEGAPAPGGEPRVFQARLEPQGPLVLPADLAPGTHRLLPDPRVLCEVLGGAAPGRAVTPVASTTDCALSTLEVTDRPLLLLGSPQGALDARLGELAPSAWRWGGFPPRGRQVEVQALGGGARVRLELEGGPLRLPEDAALCRQGRCGGALALELAAGETASLELRVHPRRLRWRPLAALLGVPAGPPPWEGPLRLCPAVLDAPGGAAPDVRCTDCQRPMWEGCLEIPLQVEGALLHPASWLLLALSAALLAWIRWAPRFPRGLSMAGHELRRLHGARLWLARRPLYVVVRGGRRPALEPTPFRAGEVVAEIRPASPSLGGRFEMRAPDRAWEVRRGGVRLGEGWSPFSLDPPRRAEIEIVARRREGEGGSIVGKVAIDGRWGGRGRR